jgi:aspartyl-tRNA(Asn)/glutamyl-tRNA(Gln) amidotransferase subunit C
MAIRREDVTRCAELARLELSEEELERAAADLSRILEYAAALDRLDLAGCEPESLAPAEPGLREDVTDGDRLETEDALAMAPEAEAGFFLVPPVVEDLEP